jgi:hypothetical protein
VSSPTPNPAPDVDDVGGQSNRLAQLFSDLDADPRYSWTTRRRNRLLLVALQASFLVVALVLLALERPIWALLAFLTFFPLMSLINVGIHGLLEVPVAHLDDVMVRVRTEAKAKAHTILVALVGVLLVLAPLGASLAGTRFADDVRGAIVVPSSVVAGLFFVALLLPRWIVAWRLPDQAAADLDH